MSRFALGGAPIRPTHCVRRRRKLACVPRQALKLGLHPLAGEIYGLDLKPEPDGTLAAVSQHQVYASGRSARRRRVHEGNFPRQEGFGFIEADHLRKPFRNQVSLVEPVRTGDHRGSGTFPDAVAVDSRPLAVMLDRTDAAFLSAWNAALLKRTDRGSCIRVQGDPGKFLASVGQHTRKRRPVPFRDAVPRCHENICSRVITSSGRWL